VKGIAFKDHNITIASAAISVPKWMNNGLETLFVEACLLADIGTFEPPRNRVDMASRIVDHKPGNEELTVVEHGIYFLEVSRMKYDKKEREFRSSTAQAMDDLGTSKLISMTVNEVLAHNKNYTLAEQSVLQHLNARALLLETNAARWSIRYNSSLLPAETPFEDRYLSLEKAYPMLLNLTGRDVVAAEDKYAKQVRARIWYSRLDFQSLFEHFACKSS
jgi:hypothetical protein